MLRRAGLFSIAAIAALAATPLTASPDLADIDLAAERAAIEQFQRFDQRLQDVGWKLAHHNARFCPESMPAVGLQLQDMASYGRPDVARAALGLERDFAVQTAARGSPAGDSGEFIANREIRYVGPHDPNGWDAEDRLDWERLKRTHDEIDRNLDRIDELSVVFADGEEVRILPVAACVTRFELASNGDRAVADGERVVFGMGFEGFGYAEELFAAAVAHELAHNMLSHRAWLDRNKRTRSHVRSTEREADRLMPWLLANAGYDPAAAVEFLAKFKPTSGSVLFIPGTHAKWKDRVAAVQAEVPRVRALMESEGEADWSVHFEREIDPDKGL